MVNYRRSTALLHFYDLVLRKKLRARYLGIKRRGDYGFLLTSNEEVRSKRFKKFILSCVCLLQVESSDSEELLMMCYIFLCQYLMTSYTLEVYISSYILFY